MRIVPKRLKWLGLGAVLAWLFDLEKGHERRRRIAERASMMVPHAGRKRELGAAGVPAGGAAHATNGA